MIIDPIAAPLGSEAVAMTRSAESVNTNRVSFETLVAGQVESLNQTLLTSDAVATEFALGGQMPVHDVMLSMEQARLTLQLAVEVRNRAVESYQELMRMQL